jgi:hypothetical protein
MYNFDNKFTLFVHVAELEALRLLATSCQKRRSNPIKMFIDTLSLLCEHAISSCLAFSRGRLRLPLRPRASRGSRGNRLEEARKPYITKVKIPKYHSKTSNSETH